jgi:hypothetical protein
MFSNPDALWIFIYVFYTVAALSAVFAVVTLVTVIRESRRHAVPAGAALPTAELSPATEPARQAA